MKRLVIIFGLIAGLIVSSFMAVTMAFCHNSEGFNSYIGMLIGYTSMIVAFSFVFVGVKNYRDKQLGGYINFGKAFIMGLYITLIASTMYVLVWVVEYKVFIPDFMDKYTAQELANAKKNGISGAELKAKTDEMAMYTNMYKNPLMIVLLTYAEILPVGLIVTLISALILKRKPTNLDALKTA